MTPPSLMPAMYYHDTQQPNSCAVNKIHYDGTHSSGTHYISLTPREPNTPEIMTPSEPITPTEPITPSKPITPSEPNKPEIITPTEPITTKCITSTENGIRPYPLRLVVKNKFIAVVNKSLGKCLFYKRELLNL